LLKNEKKMLNKLVEYAIKNGLINDIEKAGNSSKDISEDFYYSIIDFITCLEDLLSDNLDNMFLQEKVEKKMRMTINKMKTSSFNIFDIKSGIQKAKEELFDMKLSENFCQDDINKKANKVLLLQILKNWNPGKKDLCN
jgi:hypothetical protein